MIKYCIYNKCIKTVSSKSYCSKHYQAFIKFGPGFIGYHPRSLRKKDIGCKYQDCVRSHYAKGYCNKHYFLIKRENNKKYKPHKFDYKDGRSKNDLILNYYNMIYQCYNKDHRNYHNVGGRGIKVCENWLNDFWKFVKDVEPKPEGMCLSRINPNKDFCSTNVHWVSVIQVRKNRALNSGLNMNKLAKATGYSRERIRQLTRPISGYSNKKYPLKSYILKEIIKNKQIVYFYHKSAIDFLLQKRNKNENSF